ncbi:hypothetical protein CFC21_001624 [Triticum aestivum]|uniref:Uncharacterized protein n=1 Tax=Triticum aestivum TaxID=4565 RepID=A0A3B5XY95_WHEAT|nr:hypothetical protein CFC21_001624 [Triticum aestivum]
MAVQGAVQDCRPTLLAILGRRDPKQRMEAQAASRKEDDGGSRGPPDRDEEEGAHREEDEGVKEEKGAAREH